jgi:hypothetical protein
MKRSANSKFLRRIRIRGGEFDASARAMHRKAAVENVSIATIERKLMSTKTTFKRIALVAVAAVGLGMLSGVAANAAAAPLLSITTGYAGAGTAAGTQVVGGQSSVDITTYDSTTTVAVSGVGSVVSSTITGTTPAITYGTNTFSMPAGRGTLLLTSSVAGVTTVSLTPIGTGGVPGTAVTATVTWGANVVPTLNHSTAYISTTTTSPATADTASIATTAPASAAPTARLTVMQYSSADSATVLTTANTTAVVASISGAGSVSTYSNGTYTGPSATVAAGGSANGESDFYVYSNGVAGVGTITVSVNGVAVSTKTVVFAGTLASFSFTPTKTVIGIGTSDPVAVAGLDSNGNAATLGTYYLSSSNTAVAQVPSSAAGIGSAGTATVTGIGVGTAVITVTNLATLPTITKTFTVTVGKTTAKTVTMTFDKSSYAAGEKMILTVTATGADGTAIGDNAAFNAFAAAVTSNVALQGTLPGTVATGILAGQVAIVGGVGTFTLYAPLASGTINLTGTEGTGTDNVIANGTTAAAAITATADVSGDTSATDAANAATDAANYAADAADAATTAAEEATAAAQAAQDSADAASAAVVALGLRVAVLYAATRTQVLRLQALLVRLIKKLHA